MKPGYKSTEFIGTVATAAAAATSGLLEDPNPWVRLATIGVIGTLWIFYTWKRTRLKLQNGKGELL